MKLMEQFAKIMAVSGADEIMLPEVMPARPFLEAAGEYLGARMVFLEGVGEVRRCLTPDLTIASCLARLDVANQDPSGRFYYTGTIFREPSQVQNLVDQRQEIGMELLGEAASAEVHLGICDLWWRLLPREKTRDMRVITDDLTLFSHLLHHMSLPQPLCERLLAAYNRPRQLRRLIADGMQPKPSAHLTIAKMAVSLGEDQGRVFLADWVSQEAQDMLVGRTAEEIIDRLWLLGEVEATGGLKPTQQDCLLSYLSLECPITELGASLHARNIDIDDQFAEQMKEYQDQAQQLPWAAEQLLFQPAGTERMDYYSGFSFYAVDRQQQRYFAGGRYDNLIAQLGGPDLPAYGGSMRLDLWEDEI